MKSKESIKLFMLFVAIVFFDFVSKGVVNFLMTPSLFSSSTFPYGGIAVFHNFFGIDFCIHHVTNKGAAWGIGEQFQHLLLIFRIVVLLGLLVYLQRSAKAFIYRYPLIMIAAGGLGNVIDYFVYGHVVDMFHFVFWGYSYPVFNIADAAISIGIGWLVVFSLFQKKKNVISQAQ